MTSLEPWRVLLGCAFLLLVPVGAAALYVVAPDAETPRLTAFHPGDGNATALVATARAEGHRVDSLLTDLRLLRDVAARETLVVLLEPGRPLGDGEAAALDDHLAAGGAVWVAGSDGAYNGWLVRHGVLIASQPLLDPAANETGLVRLQGFGPDGGESQVLARAPGTLLLDEPDAWDVWLRAGPNVHLDIDGNGAVNRTDPPGPHTVGVARASSSGGVLLVSADATHATDGLVARQNGDNAVHLRDVLRRALAGPGRVVVDESQEGWTAAEAVPVTAVSAGLGAATLGVSWALLALLTLAAFAGLVVRRTPALEEYRPHEPTDPLREPDAESVPSTERLRDYAWEILAARTGQPVSRLKEAGAAQAAHGLSEDPRVTRALLGRATPADHEPIIREYLRIAGR